MREEIKQDIGNIPEGEARSIDEEIAFLEEEVTRRELFLRGIAVGSGLVLSSLLPGCAEIPETREVAEATLTPEPTATATSTLEPTIPPKPSLSPTATATATEEPSPTSEPATPIPEPTVAPEEPQVYVTAQKITSYSSPGEEHGYIIPGKKFTILEEEDGWLHIRLARGAEVWIQASETAYYPEGEVPPSTPTPETPPPAVCTEPHWKERTPDRKTGYYIVDGQYEQHIFPDNPYVMWYFKMPDGSYAFRRDARIIAIDRENQIITFQLSDGSTRQRRFTPNTKVIMIAHEWKRGLPMSQLIQSGGNFCDLEVDDVVSILHPDEPEAANPDPNLTNLWGAFIPQ